jgi:hypothetical protein
LQTFKVNVPLRCIVVVEGRTRDDALDAAVERVQDLISGAGLDGQLEVVDQQAFIVERVTRRHEYEAGDFSRGSMMGSDPDCAVCGLSKNDPIHE